MSADWTVIGVPVDCSGNRRGEERAPAALRKAGLVEALGARDAGDLDAWMHDPRREADSGMIGYKRVCELSGTVRDAVRESLREGERPLVVGGCCTLVPGVMAGVRQAVGEFGLAYLDGHLDFYDGVSSGTGEAAEMPIAILVGIGPQGMTDLAGTAPIVAEQDIVILGERDRRAREEDFGQVPPSERAPELTHITATELRALGPQRAAAAAAAKLRVDERPVWLHLDVDLLDEAVMPAVTYPQPGGPDWDDVLELARPFLTAPRLIGIDVTDFNPDGDHTGSHARTVVQQLARMLEVADTGQ
jgi:arginase